ncbi:MAG: efflux RND transporter permease subunit, partial [Geminicoccaceae bacterium]
MLSSFFIDRPKFALVISIVFLLAGGIAINLIPIAEFPEITPPQVQVSTQYPGANATVVEQSVATPIEAQVNGVDDMIYMSSTSSNNGDYTLTVTFEVGTDPDIAAVNVQNSVTIASPQLPQEVRDQGVTTRKQSANILLIVNMTSPDESREGLFLSNYASIYMQDRLARINGVGSVSQFGALDYGMRVWMDPDRLTSLDLTTADIAQAIESQNIQASAGQLGAPPFESTPSFQYTLQAKGRLVSVEEFENIVVRAEADGSFVRLRDIARVELGSQTYNAISKINNLPSASIAIYQSPGANALAVADQVYAELEDMAASFPPGVAYDILYDTTDSVRASIQEVILTLFITFVLVVLVTFMFLGDWRSTLIPTVAIPVSLIGAFAVLFAVGFSANMVTLFAVILAIGIVVDDSIVVVENVQRVMSETGANARDATRVAMGEVTGPVIATTLVLLAVFVPVTFMPGITGELYKQFALTICVAVVISSINALTLAPALCSILLKPGSGTAKGPLRAFARLVDFSRDGYVWVVDKLIRMMPVALLVLVAFAGGTYLLFQKAPTGFIPIEDKGAFFINIQLPDGASLVRTEQVADEATDMLLATDGVTDAIAISGYSILGGAASNSALVIAILAPWDERTTAELGLFAILGKVNQNLAVMPAATAFGFPVPPISGLGTSGGIEAQLQDYESKSPQELAAAVRSLTFGANQDPVLTDVFSTFSANVPQLFLEVDRDKAETLGVEIAEIFRTLQANLGSLYIN